jgi:hypothetical protein
MSILKSVSGDLHASSRDVLGDLQQRIKKKHDELEGIRCHIVSEANVRKEQVVGDMPKRQ